MLNFIYFLTFLYALSTLISLLFLFTKLIKGAPTAFKIHKQNEKSCEVTSHGLKRLKRIGDEIFEIFPEDVPFKCTSGMR